MKIKSVKNDKVNVTLSLREFKILEFLLQCLDALDFDYVNNYLYDKDEFKNTKEYKNFVTNFKANWNVENIKMKLFAF